MTSPRGRLKVAILTNVPSLAKMTSMAKIRQPLNYMPNKVAKGSLGKWSGEFGEIRQRCDWTSYDISKGSPSIVAILTKMVNMAMRPKWRIRHFREICHFRQNHYFSRGPFAHLWIYAKPLANFRQICHFCRFRHSSLFKGPLWIFLNFRQTFDELSPDYICHFHCCMHFGS